MHFVILNRHPPRKRRIQYAAALRLNHWRPGILGRPVKPGGDDMCEETRGLNVGLTPR